MLARCFQRPSLHFRMDKFVDHSISRFYSYAMDGWLVVMAKHVHRPFQLDFPMNFRKLLPKSLFQ